MKNNAEDLNSKRYDILKPYILKEKNLKELSLETDISYSTLKRWASSYKKYGLDGLKKSCRSDKDTYRTLNEETIIFLKKLYIENPNLKIFDYYTKCIDFIKSIGEKVVSYDTVYRVINQLNPYIHEFIPNNHIDSKTTYEVLEIEYSQINCFILDERDNSLKKPYLTIIYDNHSEIIYDFFISFDKITLYEIFSLLRNSILLSGIEDKYYIPKELIINNLKSNNSDSLDKVSKTLDIKISFSLGVKNKLQDFFDAYNNYFIQELVARPDESLSFSTLIASTREYINNHFKKFIPENSAMKLDKFKKINSHSSLDILLTPYKSKRKIKNGTLRFQNLVYKNPILSKYNDFELEIRYNPSDLSKIRVYDFNFFICELNSKIIGDYPLSYYELLCIKKSIMAKHIKNLKAYSLEFKSILENRYTK